MRNRGFKLEIVIFWIASFSQVLPANSQSVMQYTIKNGLPSSEVYKTYRDLKGILWFATDAGVSKYDGYNFKNFTTRDGLVDNTIFDFYEDSKNRLWLRSYSGKLAYMFKDKCYAFPNNDKLLAILAGNSTTSMYVDSGDTIWIGCKSNHIIKIDLNDPNLTPIKIDLRGPYVKILNNHSYVYSFHHAPSSIIQIDNEKSTSTYIPPFIIDDQPTAGHSRFLITARGNRFLTTFNRLIPLHDSSYAIPIRQRGQIILVKETANGDLWIGYSRDRGVDRFIGGDLNKKPISYFEGKTISDVYQDPEKGLWFASVGDGVFYMGNTNIRTLPPEKSRVNRIVAVNEEKILVGCNDGSLAEYGIITEKRQRVSKSDNFFNNYTTIIKAGQDNFWLGGNGGCVGYSATNKSFFCRQISPVRSLTIENDSTLVGAYSEGGIRRIMPCKDMYYEDPIEGLNEQVSFVFYDHKKNLWVASLNGLYSYNGKDFKKLGSR